jgi:hypothetical protein
MVALASGVLGAASPPDATATPTAHAKVLLASRLSRSGGWARPYRDAVLPQPSARTLRTLALPLPAGFWGGTYTASNGETVSVAVSDYYFQDPAGPQSVAEFFATGLTHGSELAQLAGVVIEPLPVVQADCGGSPYVLACYYPNAKIMVIPGEDPYGIALETIVAHEYGHHVAFHRVNTPWPAVDWGTKRWASYEQICARTQQGTAFPGDEGEHYTLNPGEAFAETYRVLNEMRWGVTTPTWDVVDSSFFPDAGSLQAVDQDVTAPWTTNTGSRRVGRFLKNGARIRPYPLATPLDGVFAVSVRSASGPYTVSVIDKRTGRQLRAGRGFAVTVCGLRTATLVVHRRGNPGRFTLTASRP